MRIKEEGRKLTFYPESKDMSLSFARYFREKGTPRHAWEIQANGVSASDMTEIRSVRIRDGYGMSEFADMHIYMQGLENVVIHFDDRSKGHRDSAMRLSLPDSVKHLHLANTAVKEVEGKGLEDLYLVNNKELTGISCRTERLNHILMAEMPQVNIDYEWLLGRNEKIKVYGDIHAHNKSMDRALSNPRFYCIESMNGTEAVIVSKAAYREMKEAVSRIIRDNITPDMSKMERAAKLCEYAARNFMYPQDGEFIDRTGGHIHQHLAAGTFLTKDSVCEGQARALAFLMKEAGIEAEPVLCSMNLLPRNAILETRDKDKGYLQEGEAGNHIIMRFKIGESWYYADPTNDAVFNAQGSARRNPQLSFLSKDDMMYQALRNKSDEGYLYTIAEGERDIPSHESLPRMAVLGLRDAADRRIAERDGTVVGLFNKIRHMIGDILSPAGKDLDPSELNMKVAVSENGEFKFTSAENVEATYIKEPAVEAEIPSEPELLDMDEALIDMIEKVLSSDGSELLQEEEMER